MERQEVLEFYLSSDLTLEEREDLKVRLRPHGKVAAVTERGPDVWHEVIRFAHQHHEVIAAGGVYVATKMADEFFAWLRSVRERREKEQEQKAGQRRSEGLIKVVDPVNHRELSNPIHATQEQVRRFVG